MHFKVASSSRFLHRHQILYIDNLTLFTLTLLIRFFFQEHAATCGDETEIVTRSTSKISKITCEICDAVIPLSTAYEVHVKDCISAKLLSENK